MYIGRIKSTDLARLHIRKHSNARANKICDNVRCGVVQLARAARNGLLAYQRTSETQPLQMKCVYQNYAQKTPKEDYRTVLK